MSVSAECLLAGGECALNGVYTPRVDGIATDDIRGVHAGANLACSQVRYL